MIWLTNKRADNVLTFNIKILQSDIGVPIFRRIIWIFHTVVYGVSVFVCPSVHHQHVETYPKSVNQFEWYYDVLWTSIDVSFLLISINFRFYCSKLWVFYSFQFSDKKQLKSPSYYKLHPPKQVLISFWKKRFYEYVIRININL